MRRTLALLGIAALATIGLAGPANASEINTPDQIQFTNAGPDGTGVTFNAATPTDSWFTYETTSGVDESLAGLGVEGCVGPNLNPTTFVVDFGAEFVLANEDHINADPMVASVTPDTEWIASGLLNDDSYSIVLFDSVGSLGVIDTAQADLDSELVQGCLNQLPL